MGNRTSCVSAGKPNDSHDDDSDDNESPNTLRRETLKVQDNHFKAPLELVNQQYAKQ